MKGVSMSEFDDGIENTPLPDGAVVETDVLIVGSGPAGASAALALSTYGIPNIMITKYRWTANTPRAHITNQRAMEFFRDMGIEDEVKAVSTPHNLIGDTVFCSSFAGEEFGRILAWGTSPEREGDYVAASPTLNCDVPQNFLEPVLVSNATKRGTQTRFSSEYISHTQDSTGVTTIARDRVTGREYSIRSQYLIGADGARSKVAADIDLPFEGQMDIAGSMNITFKAELASLVDSRPSVLYWVVQPGANVGGIGAGLVRMVRPWNEWLIVWGYDISQPPPSLDHEAALEIVHSLLGTSDIAVEITGTSLWGNNEMFATSLQNGRVFCAGDAVHRHPPSNGLGSNTSVQDSYNLAWKLAAVLRGAASPTLLDTYTEERGPVAKQIVLRANKSSREFGGFS
jgi:2,4-dichlorophenol 6-monooxygenase